MGLMWDDMVWDDYLYWQTQDRKTLKKLNALIKDIQRSPFFGTGKPESLKDNLNGCWSRRIDKQNRVCISRRATPSLSSPAAVTTTIEGRIWY